MTGYACCQHCNFRPDGTCEDLHPGYPAHDGDCPTLGCTVGRAQVAQEAAQEARGGPNGARTTTVTAPDWTALLFCRHGDIDTRRPEHQWVPCVHLAMYELQSVENHDSGYKPTPMCERHATEAQRYWHMHSIRSLNAPDDRRDSQTAEYP